jgi:hypothetical protein
LLFDPRQSSAVLSARAVFRTRDEVVGAILQRGCLSFKNRVPGHERLTFSS